MVFGLGKKPNITQEELPFLSGLVLWLAANEGVIYNIAGLVSQWTDLSGQGNNFTQPTGANQPTWSQNGGPNSQPCINFASAAMQSLYINSVVLQSASAYTLFIIQKFLSNASVMLSFSCGNNSDGLFLSCDGLGSNERNITFDNGSAFNFLNGGAATTNWEQWTNTSSASATTVALRVNGTQTVSSANTAQSGTSISRIGGGEGNVDMLNGSIAEIIGYNVALTTNQILSVEAYLKGKYGV